MAVTGDAVVEEVVNNLTSQINVWIKGLGIIAAVIIVYSLIMFWMNKKQAKDLNRIKKDIDEINEKLDKLTKKK